MKKKIKIGLIFWSVFAVVIAICFLIAKGRIASVLKETDFFNEVTGSEPSVITDLINSTDSSSLTDESQLTERDEVLEKSKKIKKSKDKKIASNKNSSSSNEEKNIDERTDEQIISKIMEVEKSSENKAVSNVEEKVLPKKEEIKESPKEQVKEIATQKKDEVLPSENKVQETKSPEVKTMNLNVCLVQIAGDGSIVRREVIRTVEKNSSPLTTAINLLLKGPSLEELSKGYISVIPENSSLISARITNKTAILNFNDEFTYNSYGVQGQIAQLMQIVYTATSFSTIDNVQFLINGEKIEYLGGEGVWIGSPLSRFSFK